MKLEFSKSFLHNSPKEVERKHPVGELKNLLTGLLKKNGISGNVINETEDGTIELDEKAASKLHKVMLDAEEMGLSIKYTKKTSIEIS